MKIGIVTDTHIGEQENVENHLKTLSNYFKKNSVTKVIHLGDIATESLDAMPLTTESERDKHGLYWARVKAVESYFDWADSYIPTMGNHDAESIPQTYFNAKNNTYAFESLWNTGTSEGVLVNSAGENMVEGLGYLSQSVLSKLKEKAINNDELHIFSHYPLQYTDYYQNQPFFKTHPEYTFPVNKGKWGQISAHLDCEFSYYSGHLHPPETITVQTEPTGDPLTIFEPVQKLIGEDTPILSDDGLSDSIEDLIIDTESL